MAPDSGAPTAARLRREHLQLERLFQRHQLALVTGSTRQAQRCLRRYRELLDAHTRIEDRLLETVCRLGLATRWPVAAYRAEHRKLSALLDRLCGEIEALPDGALPAPRLIELIEREKTLKGVAEHHQAREEQDLYTLLDRSPDGSSPDP